MGGSGFRIAFRNACSLTVKTLKRFPISHFIITIKPVSSVVEAGSLQRINIKVEVKNKHIS
jgi:hypothetical protein